MKTFKIYLSLIFLGILPLIFLLSFNYAKEEVHETYCADRHYCSWHYCEDYECLKVRERDRIYERSLFYVIKQYPVIVLLLVLYVCSYIGYLIGLKRNAYSYIGYEDLGKLGLVSLIMYFVDALLIVFVPMFIYSQIGTGALITMLVMAVVPFIVRPIIVDW